MLKFADIGPVFEVVRAYLQDSEGPLFPKISRAFNFKAFATGIVILISIKAQLIN